MPAKSEMQKFYEVQLLEITLAHVRNDANMNDYTNALLNVAASNLASMAMKQKAIDPLSGAVISAKVLSEFDGMLTRKLVVANVMSRHLPEDLF